MRSLDPDRTGEIDKDEFSDALQQYVDAALEHVSPVRAFNIISARFHSVTFGLTQQVHCKELRDQVAAKETYLALLVASRDQQASGQPFDIPLLNSWSSDAHEPANLMNLNTDETGLQTGTKRLFMV